MTAAIAAAMIAATICDDANVTVAATASSLAKWSPQRAKEADERDRDDEDADDHRHCLH